MPVVRLPRPGETDRAVNRVRIGAICGLFFCRADPIDRLDPLDLLDPGYHSSVRAVGIDFGLRRIGVAVSDASRVLARPLETLQRPTGGDETKAVHLVLDVLQRLDREGDPADTLVVGLPRRLDGSPNDQTPLVERFVARLRAATPIAVVLQDERLSSHEAESRLAERERDWRKRKARLDAAAAAVILQDYLDAERPAGSIDFDAPSSRCAD